MNARKNAEGYNTLKQQKTENYKTFTLFHMPLSITLRCIHGGLRFT
nr:MAG TPA: hypothetical protein [Caudoviricetes sp.]